MNIQVTSVFIITIILPQVSGLVKSPNPPLQLVHLVSFLMKKKAFLIKICPLSIVVVVLVVVIVVVVVVVNFNNYQIAKIHWGNKKNLPLNNKANFNQTWHKASLGDGDSGLFKWRARASLKGDNSEIAKIHWRN